MLKHVLLTSAAFAAVCASASAQDAARPAEALRLNSVDVAGLRPVAREDTTSAITVIEADALAVRDAPWLADQLRAVPGVGLSRSGAVGGLTQIRIRGAEANHTLALLDGFEVSDPTTGETDFGLLSGLYPARIEVARGEQSALYGSDAIGGVVNIVTSDAAGARALLEAGSRETYRVDGAYGFAFDTASLNIGFSSTATDGVDTSGNDGERDGSAAWSGLASGAVQLNETWRASGLFRYSDSEVDTDPDLDFDGLLDNADRVTESEQWTLGAALYGEALGLSHVLRASYNDVTRENFADGASTDSTIGERTTLSYSPSREFALSGADLRMSGLVEHQSEDYQRIGVASPFGDPNQSQSFDTLGLAGEARLETGDLIATVSARHDDNDGRFEDAGTWRAGAAYRLGSARLRASAGTGVKNPTFVELFGFFPGSFVGNADLKPEQSTSWELGWDQDFGPVQTSLTYFQAELENEIFTQFNPDFTSSPANRAGESERSGVEASASWAVSPALSLQVSASHIVSENEAGIDEIRVPEWTGSAALNWQSTRKEGLRAGIAADYVGTQLDTDFGTFQTVELDAYWLVSATAQYPINDRLAVTVRGENLLDETVTDVFGFTGPGAGVFIGLRLR